MSQWILRKLESTRTVCPNPHIGSPISHRDRYTDGVDTEVAMTPSQSPATKQVLLTMRADYVDALDNLVRSGAGSNRSDLMNKIVGGFIADLRNKQNPAQNQQETALGNFIAFLLMVVGLAAILKALGGKD